MRDAGAREVHFRLASRRSCIPIITASTCRTAAGLSAATHSLEEMRDIIGADSLAFLSIDACTAPWASPAAIPPIRNSRTTVLPAPIRPTSPTNPGRAAAPAIVAAGGSELTRPRCRPCESRDP